MAKAVFLRDIKTKEYYRISIWFKDSRGDDAIDCLRRWEDINTDLGTLDPILIPCPYVSGE